MPTNQELSSQVFSQQLATGLNALRSSEPMPPIFNLQIIAANPKPVGTFVMRLYEQGDPRNAEAAISANALLSLLGESAAQPLTPEIPPKYGIHHPSVSGSTETKAGRFVVRAVNNVFYGDHRPVTTAALTGANAILDLLGHLDGINFSQMTMGFHPKYAAANFRGLCSTEEDYLLRGTLIGNPGVESYGAVSASSHLPLVTHLATLAGGAQLSFSMSYPDRA